MGKKAPEKPMPKATPAKPNQTPAAAAKSAVATTSQASSSKPPPTNANKPAQEAKPTVAGTIVNAAIIKPPSSSVPVVQNKSLSDLAQMIMDEIKDPSEPISFLAIDPSERLQAFLRHRDTVCINLMDVNALNAERFRLAVISALRYNKPLIFDLMDNEKLIDTLRKYCGELGPTLFDDLFNGQIKNQSKFIKLIKESDGDIFKPWAFVYMNSFKVVLLLSKPTSNENILKLASPFKAVYTLCLERFFLRQFYDSYER